MIGAYTGKQNLNASEEPRIEAPAKTLLELKARFLEHLVLQNFAESTREGASRNLDRFLAFLAEEGIESPMAVTKDLFQEYRATLSRDLSALGRPYNPHTLNNFMVAVKMFFKFLREHDYLINDPVRDVRYAKVPKRLPRAILSQAEMRKLLKAPDTKTALGYRDRAILETFYSTGVRREELCNLNLEDLDLGQGFVRVNLGKGAKDRVVPVGKIASRYLENYIQAVRPGLCKDPRNLAVFVAMSGKRLSPNMVWCVVKKYVAKTGLNPSISPHSLRHTCATAMLRGRANVRHIQALLGHESLDTTAIYTHVSIEDLKAVHARCHPREREGA